MALAVSACCTSRERAMAQKMDPRGGLLALALLALGPLVLVGVRWLPSHMQAWQATLLARPECGQCPSSAAATAAPPPQAEASSGSDETHKKLAILMRRVRRLPWRAWLRQAEARRGVTYYGSGAALRRLAAKLLTGQPVSIVAIGGSVTFFGGPDPSGQSYVAHLFQYINSTFPHRYGPAYLWSTNNGTGAVGAFLLSSFSVMCLNALKS